MIIESPIGVILNLIQDPFPSPLSSFQRRWESRPDKNNFSFSVWTPGQARDDRKMWSG